MNKPERYKLADLLKLKPGCLLFGLVNDKNGIGIGSSWNLSRTTARFCIPEYFACLKDKIIVSTITGSGVSVYTTSKREFKSIIYQLNNKETEKDNKLNPDLESAVVSSETGKTNESQQEEYKPPAYRKIIFEKDKVIGIFLGSLLRVEDTTYINLLTLNGEDVWLEC